MCFGRCEYIRKWLYHVVKNPLSVRDTINDKSVHNPFKQLTRQLVNKLLKQPTANGKQAQNQSTVEKMPKSLTRKLTGGSNCLYQQDQGHTQDTQGQLVVVKSMNEYVTNPPCINITHKSRLFLNIRTEEIILIKCI